MRPSRYSTNLIEIFWESVNKRNLGSKLAKKWNGLHMPTKGNVCFKMKRGGLEEKEDWKLMVLLSFEV